jgi:shikimate kinase
MNIYLIGYRCTGKTTVGKRIADRFDWPFMDADEELVAEQGSSIADIVAARGWDAFREMEKCVIKRLSQKDAHVIAPGGGAVLNPVNADHMKSNGILIWLRATPETIITRMLQDQSTEEQRPSLTSKGLDDEIRDTLKQRTPIYEQAADLSIDTDDIDIETVCARALNELEARGVVKKEN